MVKAIRIYEKVANKNLQNNLTRSSAKDLWVKCLILFMVLDDDVGYERSVDKYLDLEPSFTNNMDLKYVGKLYKAVQAKDSEALSEVSNEWMQRANMDKWKINQLSYVKREIEKKNPPKKKNPADDDSDEDYGHKNAGAGKENLPVYDADDFNPY